MFTRSLLGTALTLVALTVLAAPSPAAVTYGSALDKPPTDVGCVAVGPGGMPAGDEIGCSMTQVHQPTAAPLPIAGPLPANGVVTRFRISTDVAYLGTSRVVAMPLLFNPGFGIAATGAQVDIPVTVAGIHTFTTRIPVAAGQRLGIYVRFTAGPLAASQVVGVAWTHYSAGGEGVTRRKQASATAVPDLTDPATETPESEALVNFDVEPDVDGDGLGDETQDLSVPTVTRKAAKQQNILKQKSVKLTVTSSESGVATASATVKVKGELGSFNLGPVATLVAANKPTTVKLKLTKRKLKQLKKVLRKRRAVTFKTHLVVANQIGRSTPDLKDTIRAQLPKKR